MSRLIKSKEKKYWLEKLSGELTRCNFPYDYVKVSSYQNDRETLSFRLPGHTYDELMKIGNASPYAIYVIVMTGLTYLLYKYTGNQDILMGSPVFQPKTPRILHNKLLPLRTRVDREKSFKDLLQEVKKTVVEANQNNNYTLKDTVKQIGLVVDAWGDDTISSLFDVFVLFKNIHAYNEEIFNNNEYVILFCFEMKEGYMACEINYNAALYNKLTVNRLFQHLVNFINVVSHKPNLKLAEIEIISEEEKKATAAVNQTQKTFPRKGTIPTLFSLQAGITPGNTAVIEYGSTMTYKVLEIESNKIARVLLESGVNSNEPIALYADRGRQYVAAILGILKSGCAYVPIDPGYPKQRIEYIFRDTTCRVLVTESSLVESIIDYIPQDVAIIVCLDKIDNIDISDLKTQGITLYSYQDIIQQTDEPLDLAQLVKEDHLAYIIHTSGSTGNPKGVTISHKAVLNTLLWLDDIFHLSSEDVVAQKTSASFTDSVWEFFWPLVVGSKLSIFDDADVKIPRRLFEKLKEDNITFTQFVPPLMSIFLKFLHSLDDPYPLPALKWVFNGGEALPVTLVKDWYQQFKKAKIANIYGTTETAIYASYHLIEREPNQDQLRIPIGRPIANASIYILDEMGGLCPINIQGEICVGGTSLTNGYWRQPSLNEQAFTRHPVTEEPLYRTGDNGFLDHDGIFQYTGRRDYQVQVRGYRVELAEIVNRLLGHKNIKEAVVLPVTEDEGYTSLEAYFTSDQDLSQGELREYLITYLPDYMIPAYFFRLGHFPLTPHGKIDRKALPSLKKANTRGKPYAAPGNPAEYTISEIMQKVLKVEKLGIHDNLFEFGANSLKVVQVLAQLSTEFEITMDDIFEYPTIAQLANVVSWKKDNLKNKIQHIKKKLGADVPLQLADILQPSEYDHLLKEEETYNIKMQQEETKEFKGKKNYKRLLLTGATGFLGIHLLAELLETTKAQMYLLVRADTLEKAYQNLKQKMSYYLGMDFFKKYKQRFKVIRGDLRRNRLGMDEKTYRRLSETLEAVVHSAAIVKHFGRYEDYYENNVRGTERLLQFSLTNRKKDFFYISTLGLGMGKIAGKKYFSFTEYCHDIGQEYTNVYLRSKFEAEKIVLSYREKGLLDTSIYRVGNLAFHSRTGKFQENIEENEFYANVKGFVTLKSVPDIKGFGFGLTFVDQAARAMVLLMTNPASMNETFHLENPSGLQWPRIVSFLEKAGVSITIRYTEQFFDSLLEHIDRNEHQEEISQLLLHFGIFTEEIQPQRNVKIRMGKTLKILKKLGFQWPEPNEMHIQKMVEHCREVGFFPQTEGRRLKYA